MNRMRGFVYVLAYCLFTAADTTSCVAESILFFDSFESGNLSTTNGDGFAWASPNRTSIVTQSSANGNTVIFADPRAAEQGVINDGRDWTAREGNNSMRFQFPAGEPWTEQRFKLGGAYRDIWFRFWLRVPTNFSHGSRAPTNNKLFALWMDDYSNHGEGPTVVWEFWNDGKNGSRLAVHYQQEGQKVGSPHLQLKQFIDYPQDQGRWMELVFNVEAATDRTSNDGTINMWRRWDQESEYQHFHSLSNLNIAPPPGGPVGWANGYLMGWSNPSYALQTDWLMDSFTVSEHSLLRTIIPEPSSCGLWLISTSLLCFCRFARHRS